MTNSGGMKNHFFIQGKMVFWAALNGVSHNSHSYPLNHTRKCIKEKKPVFQATQFG